MTFQIIPAIDLMNGKCVRLIQGDKSKVLLYPIDPLEVAQEYTHKGAKIIHVIDLDGAFSGQMKNVSIVKELARSVPIQLGGGIRSEEQISVLLDSGVQRVILGTLLLKDPANAALIKKKFKGKIIGSFDFKNSKLTYAGWVKQSEKTFEEVSSGLDEIIVTDTTKDGMLGGPNIELLKTLRTSFNGKIIAAGGIRNESDLRELANIGIDGGIVGRAMLEGSLKEKLEAIRYVL